MSELQGAIATVGAAACGHCGFGKPAPGGLCPRCGGGSEYADMSSRVTLPADDSTLPLRVAHATPFEGEEDDSLIHAGPDPLIGFVVAGRYRIVEQLGRGGMGIVYKVEHVELGKLLALKLLAGELSREREVLRRFKREALLASKLSHPNTVQVFDFGVSDGLTYLVMELVNGQDLARVIKSDGALSCSRLSRIVVQICSSLAEAHGLGIVHRDLKPENIIVSKSLEGEELAKVLDFGLAKLREAPDLNEVSGTGCVVGTPFYMAPEQIHGHAVDERADIYALGAVMYKALTGETPFTGNTPLAVLTRHLTEQAVAPHLRAPEHKIPEGISRVVMRMLEKDPAQRFQRVEEVQKALIDLAGGTESSSISALANSSQMKQLQAAAARLALPSKKGKAQGKIATRDELEAYEKGLVRQKWILRCAIPLAAGAALAAAYLAFVRATTAHSFEGSEREPNNQASDATPVPFGTTVLGRLGKRIDTNRSDRDFFRIAVPTGVSAVSLFHKALPNMPSCVFLYPSGLADPLAKFCTGRPGIDLRIPALHLEPGIYNVGIMQDREHYETPHPPFVLENVSDDYELKLEPAAAAASDEAEPNDAIVGANEVAIGAELHGTLSWLDDVDIVCVQPTPPEAPHRARFVVRDADERPRDRGAVLEVTPQSGERAGIALCVHRTDLSPSRLSSGDVVVPWASVPFVVTSLPKAHCLKLRLTTDPWTEGNAPAVPPTSNEKWMVRVEAIQ